MTDQKRKRRYKKRTKQRIIDDILDREGGHVDDPADSGGETNWGVTKAVARNCGYEGDMKDMERDFAIKVYTEMYWDRILGDELEQVSGNIAEEVMDTAVNCGVGASVQFLQRSLNLFNDGGRLYADVNVDGSMGPATMQALNSFAMKRDITVLVRLLNCLQGAMYADLAERNPKNERFVYGWLTHRVG